MTFNLKNGVKNILTGNNTDSKARLHKKPEAINYYKLCNFIYKYELAIYISLTMIALFLFCVICFTICGISAVESGGMRNFINGGYL